MGEIETEHDDYVPEVGERVAVTDCIEGVVVAVHHDHGAPGRTTFDIQLDPGVGLGFLNVNDDHARYGWSRSIQRAGQDQEEEDGPTAPACGDQFGGFTCTLEAGHADAHGVGRGPTDPSWPKRAQP